MKNKKRLFGALVIIILALTMIATLAACGEEETVQYTVTLKSGFDDQVTTQTLNEGEVFTLPASPFIRDGYTFDYWTEEGTTYPNRVGTPIPVYRNMTFVAHWTENYVPDVPEDFTVTVKDGYGSGQITAVVTEGEEYVLPAADTFTRPEYTFGGWQVGDSVMEAGDSVTITANTEIIAVWNAIPKYNVSVLKGYGDNAPIATYVVTSGGSYTLPEMTLDYAGHNFLGYADLSGDLTEYLAAGTVIENITSNKTFVAMWEEITYYTVYLKKTADATGTDVDNSNRVTEGGSFVLPECNFVNAGYEFTGWIYEGQPMDPGDVIPNITGDIEVIAGWKLAEEPQPEQYSVTFANGKYSMAGGSYTEEEAYIIPEGSDTYYDAEEGYKFVGWTVKGDDSGKIYKPGDRYSGNSDVIFVAQWDEIIYYSIYLSAGFEGGATALVSDKVEEGTSYRYTLPQADKFSREGYTFAGWKIGEDTYSAGETVNLTVDKNITITAVWEAIPTYTVTYYYELNGAQISVSSAMYSGTKYDLIDYPADQTPPTGMRFDGWKLVRGDETVYAPGTTITVTEDAGYYAVYLDAVFTVEFSDGEKVQSSEVKEGGNVKIPAPDEKTGYTFLGWFLNGEGEALTGDHVYNVTADMCFEAKWQINSYEITFEIVYDNGFNANYEFKKEVLTVEYNNLPEPTIEIPEKIDITNDKTASFTGEWMIKNEAGEWAVSEILPATKDITYRAEVEVGARLYPVEFVQNDYVSFEIKGDDGQFTPVAEDGVVYVEYKEDLTFRLVRAPGVYIDNVKVFANDSFINKQSDENYLLKWTNSSRVSVTGWTFAKYEIYVECSNAEYEISYTELTWGQNVIIEAWGKEYYNDAAPIVLVNNEEIEGVAIENTEGESSSETTKYKYQFEIKQNTEVSISGVKTVIPVTFKDIEGNSHYLDWSADMGPIGIKLPSTISIKAIQHGADDIQIYKEWDTIEYMPELGAQYMHSFNTDPSSSQIVSESEVKENAISHLTTDIITPDPDGENVYYLLYYYADGEPQHTVNIIVPEGTLGIQYKVVDEDGAILQYGINEANAWSDTDWYKDKGESTLGYPNLWGLQYKEYGDGDFADQLYLRDLKVTGNEDIYVKLILPEEINTYPTLINSRDNKIVIEAKEQEVPVGDGTFETVYCYKIETSYADMEFVPQEGSSVYDKSVIFSYTENQSLFTLKSTAGSNIPTGQVNYLVSSEYSFKLSYKLASVDIEEMFNIENGAYVSKQSLFAVDGTYEEVTYASKLQSSTLDITVTISGIVGAITISSLYVVESEPEPKPEYIIWLELGDYYDYYINDSKVEKSDNNVYSENENIVKAIIRAGDTIEMRLRDEIAYNFVAVFMRSKTASTTGVYWEYENGYHLTWGSELTRRSITYKFSESTLKEEGSFKEGVPFRFFYQQLGYKAEHFESKCATVGGTVSILKEEVPPLPNDLTGEDSFLPDKIYTLPYINYQNGFQITVQAPLGTIPVLYIERANMLSDSFRKYYAVSKDDVGNYLYNYIFEVAGLDSEIRWYIDTEVEEFDVTIVNGDGTETVLSVPYGTKVTEIEGLPTYYMLSTETGTEFYRVYGWSATQGGAQLDENAVVAGDATYYALGEVTEAALSFTYDGGVEFYNTLADALNSDIVKNNAGVLDIFYGKTDESLTEGAYTIPPNVTLRLPYATGEYGRGYGGTSGVSKFYADKADGFTSLVIGEGATLNVAGKISVGGIIGYAASAMPYQGQTSGKHAVLELNGTMNVLSGGALYVNGYIVGTGTVELATGGASYLPFIVKDYRGGTNTDRMYSLGITPFNIYEMPNIQTNYIINYGAVEYAYAVLYASNMFNETIAEVIGTNGIIKLAEGGKVVKKTTEIENPRYSTETVSYEPQYEYRTTLDIYGGGNDGFLSLDILGLVTVTTEDFFLGIPYTYQRITLHDGEYSIVNKFKVMPGATLEIAVGATLTIESTGAIAVYEDDFDETQWTTQLNNRLQLAYPVNPNRIPAGDGVMAESGVLKVAGTLVINGSFGGLITGDDSVGVSETLPTIIVGETGVNKALSLTMKEGIYLNGNGYVFNATYIDPETGKDKVLVAMAGDKTLEYALPGQTMQFTYENGIWSK